MQSTKGNASIISVGILSASLLCLLVGWHSRYWALCSAAATIGVSFVALRTGRGERHAGGRRPIAAASTPIPRKRAVAKSPACPVQRAGASGQPETEQLVEQMLVEGRFSLLLRAQLIRYLRPDQLARAQEALDEEMALVPEGEVVLRCWGDDGDIRDRSTGRTVYVEPIYLDRYPVTNRQFATFVAQGGYEQMSLWEPHVWPGILQFVDRTGHPGPRYWEHGQPPPGKEEHPVIGVCWYEAAAYARWVGKRLPTDAEWVKAGCWPVGSSGSAPVQRRYPWGDTMDRRRANVWGTCAQATCDVTELAEGASVGGIYHLIGNVWEWTSSEFGIFDVRLGKLEMESPMKSIRGGAFDSYFDNQAQCQFQSGDNPLSRKHNIGFRCALGLCDLTEQPPASSERPARVLTPCES